MIRKIGQWFADGFRKCDPILLLLCIVTTIFGCLMIASTTTATDAGPTRYLVIQIVAAVLGVLCYVVFSSIDADFFAEHRMVMVIFNCFLLFLLIPFGVDINGNKSWLDFPILPFNIQPAEICKITYILIMASVMTSHQNRISSIPSVMHMVLHLGLLVGLNMALSRDAGVTLIFVFIFIGMAFAGGVSLLWFLIAAGGVTVAFPILWNYLMDEYQQLRLKAIFDPSVDPLGIGVRNQTVGSLKTLTGGGMVGQGLFQGHRIQHNMLFAQHTDFIFSAIGEELGFVGCTLVLVMFGLIVWRIFWVGKRSQDYMRRLICYGAAAALIFQVVVNVAMCMGVGPVIGITLPFISYGGSSIVTLYAMLGLVSGVYARPAPASHERYIRAPYSLKTYR